VKSPLSKGVDDHCTARLRLPDQEELLYCIGLGFAPIRAGRTRPGVACRAKKSCAAARFHTAAIRPIDRAELARLALAPAGYRTTKPFSAGIVLNSPRHVQLGKAALGVSTSEGELSRGKELICSSSRPVLKCVATT
jgi:hypothetical protein